MINRLDRPCKECGETMVSPHANRQRCRPCATRRAMDKKNAAKREQYANDPEFRAKERDRLRAHRDANREAHRKYQREYKRERYANDQEYRERAKAQTRAAYKRRRARAGKPARVTLAEVYEHASGEPWMEALQRSAERIARKYGIEQESE